MLVKKQKKRFDANVQGFSLFFFRPVLSDCELAPRMERFQNPLYFLFKILLMRPPSLRARGKCQERGGRVGEDQSESLFSIEVDYSDLLPLV